VTLRQEGRTPAQARNVAIVAAWVDAYNHMDFDALASIAAPDLEVDDPATGTHLQGWAAFRARAEEIVTRYPDRRITVTGVMALGDSAVAVDADPQLGGLYATAIEALGGRASLVDSHAAFVSGIREIWRLCR